MSTEPEGTLNPSLHTTPRPVVGSAFGRAHCEGRPPLPQPSEDHAEDLSGLVYLQFRGFGCRGVRSRNALAGRIVLKPVKRTDEATVAYLTADRRPQVRAQVRTYRVGHADAAGLVAPERRFPHPATSSRSVSLAEWTRGLRRNTIPRETLATHPCYSWKSFGVPSHGHIRRLGRRRCQGLNIVHKGRNKKRQDFAGTKALLHPF